MTEVEDVILLPCAVCGRTFRPEALAKHSVACERQHTKKRKKFDSAKQRIQGTELAEFLGPPPLVNKPKPPSPKKVQSRWKEKHEALVKTIRAEQVKPLDHSQCPHCDRCFGPKAFDRHEAWCKEQHSKIHVQNQNQDFSKAKQRLHARTKYRAPSFKSQRTLTKEKYSPARPPIGLSTSSTFPSPAVEHHEPRLHRNASSVSATEVGVSGSGYGAAGQKSPAMKRQNSLSRSNNRKTEEEPIRRPQDTAKKHDDPVNLSIPTLARTSRTGSLSSQGSDSKSVASSNHSYVASERVGMGSAATATPLHESKPTIKNSYSTNRDLERYDPFVTAELQMLELLRSDEGEATSPTRKPEQNISDKMTQSATDITAPSPSEKTVDKMSSSVGSSRKSSFDNIMPSVTTKRALSAGCRSDNIIVNRATRAVTAPIVATDSRLKEIGASNKTQSTDGIKLKETLRKRSLEPLATEPTRGKGVSSPSSPFRTSPTSAFFPVLNDEKETNSNPTNNNNNNNNLNNNTSINYNKNNNNNINNSDNNENEFKMLSLSTLSLCSDGSLETLEPNLRIRSSSAVPRQTKQRLNMHDLLFGLESTNEESNEGLNNNSKSRKREVERCEAQLLRSMVEFELLLNRDNDTPSPVPTPPPNLVTDSAYSSLNRRWSPSGGEQITGSGASAQDDSGALSKFCHECGGRYPVAGAKFCCLCGVRRLAI